MKFQYCELLAHFRLQFLIALTFCFTVLLVFASPFWAIAAFLGAAVNAFEIVPLYFGKSKHDNNKPLNAVRLVFANVLYGNENYEPFIKLVADEKPDIFVVQELTDGWLNALENLREIYPHYLARTEKRGGGIALFSKLPLLEKEIISLGHDYRQSIRVKFNAGEKCVALFTFHPHAPLHPAYFHHRNQQLAVAAEIINQLAAPLIVVGDLNTTVWSPFYKRFIKETNLVNAAQGFGLVPTFPVWKFPLEFLMIRIDQCFIRGDIFVKQIRTGRDIGSDHLPVIVDLEL